MPANPPQVSYLNGQLTIQSTNATLRSILNAVRQRTGAQIELPPGVGSERIATRFGPGPARDVIASFLSDSSFDFVVIGNPNTPGGVQRVILRVAAPQGRNAAGSVTAQRVAAPGPSEPEEEPAAEGEIEAPPPEIPPEIIEPQ
jgi:hypothetical protein